MAEHQSVSGLLAGLRGRMPEHEIEMLLEASFARSFPTLPRLTRTELLLKHGADQGDWVDQAARWAGQHLESGTPIQYLAGEAAFFGRIFEVGPGVLIPRPETEILVEEALEGIRPGDRPWVGAELGLGSGIISITLLLELGDRLRMVGTELTPQARLWVERNAARFGVASSLQVVEPRGGLDASRPFASSMPEGGYDFWISNPPYLDRSRSTEVQALVRAHEPAEALFAPKGDPLYFYAEMAHSASSLVRDGGWIWVEIPHERATEIEAIFRKPELGFAEVRIRADLTGRPRVLSARLRT